MTALLWALIALGGLGGLSILFDDDDGGKNDAMVALGLGIVALVALLRHW